LTRVLKEGVCEGRGTPFVRNTVGRVISQGTEFFAIVEKKGVAKRLKYEAREIWATL